MGSWNGGLFSQVPLFFRCSKTNALCNLSPIYSRIRTGAWKQAVQLGGTIRVFQMGDGEGWVGCAFQTSHQPQAKPFQEPKDEKRRNPSTQGSEHTDPEPVPQPQQRGADWRRDQASYQALVRAFLLPAWWPHTASQSHTRGDSSLQTYTNESQWNLTAYSAVTTAWKWTHSYVNLLFVVWC